MSDDSLITEARERFEACREATSEQREQMLDDLRFSNPSDPQQWPEEVKTVRAGAVGGPRPCLTFDQTNQFVFQVVNNGRQNKPAIKVRPVDSGADLAVADALQGMIRHIEDYSRADIAYDTALEYAARCGLGYLRVITEVTHDATNEQELRILRITDPMCVALDPDWQEPDGSDAMFGFIESTVTKRAFERDYPEAEVANWDGGKSGWTQKDTVRIAEYFRLMDDKVHMLQIEDPLNPGFTMDLEESEYWQAVQQTGERVPVSRTYWARKRRCEWFKMSGTELLVKKSTFPSSYIPIVPVIGSELWIEGKRSLCGLVRPMKDPQRAYNYDRSNYIEQVALQTKIPYLIAAEAVEGYEDEWGSANRSNAAYLPYNQFNAEGQPLNPPRREQPPQASQAYVQGAQQAQNDIQAAVGMYRANLGAPSNETSGKAIDSRQKQGDTANMHYTDNLARSLRQVGRILIEAIPRVYNTRRDQRILGENGKASIVTLDPEQDQAAVMKGATLASFNPAIGRYDVSVQVGPAFGTRRQEAVASLGEIINGNPQMLAMLGDVYVSLMDLPEGEKVAKRLRMSLPPEIQQAEQPDDGEGPSPEVQQIQQQAQQQVQQVQLALEGAHQQVVELEQRVEQMQAELADKEADRQADVAKVQIKADADVEAERIRAEASVAVAQSTPPATVQEPVEASEPAAPPVQVYTGTQMHADPQAAEQIGALIEQVGTMAQQLAEQNGHLFLAVSAIADQLNEPRPRVTRILRDAGGNIIGAESA